MALICIVFAALGTVIGSTLQNMQGFQLIVTSWSCRSFLSGALFPTNLPGLTIATPIELTWDRRAPGTLTASRTFRPRRTSGSLSAVAVGFRGSGRIPSQKSDLIAERACGGSPDLDATHRS
jgi:ABC-2 type transport system permease protein